MMTTIPSLQTVECDGRIWKVRIALNHDALTLIMFCSAEKALKMALQCAYRLKDRKVYLLSIGSCVTENRALYTYLNFA